MYSVPSGPVNGSAPWLKLQVPCGVGRPRVLVHSDALVVLTSTGLLKVCP